MFNRIDSFTSNQQKFLEENFEIYDPDAGTTYLEFSSLKTATVIFLAEYHHTHTINTIQRQFFNLFLNSSEIEDSRVCVLLEGVAQGEILSPKEISHFEILPSAVSIQGSDVRIKMKKYESLEFRKIKDEVIQLEQANKEHTCQKVREIAEVINKSQAQKLLEFKNDGVLLLPPSDFKLFNSLYDEYSKYQKELAPLSRRANEIADKCDDSLKLFESNEGLFEEINKASKIFDKLIPIWGLSHFTYGADLYKRLKEAKISYTVLYPNEKNRALAKEEWGWKLGKIPTVQLVLEGKLGISEIVIPKCFKAFFHPHIQRNFKSEPSQAPFVLNLEKLLSYGKSDVSFTVPANTTVHLENVDIRRCLALGEENKICDSIEKTMLLSFHDITLFTNYVFLGYDSKSTVFLRPVEDALNSIVSITSTESLVIKFGLKGAVITNLETIIFLMKRHNLFEYEIKFGRDLLLYDLKEKDIQETLALPTKFFQLIQDQSNRELKVELKGSASLSCGLNVTANLFGLGIALKEGASLLFTRKMETNF